MKLHRIALHLSMGVVFLSAPLMGAWHPMVVFGLMILALTALVLWQGGQVNNLILLPILSVIFTLSMLIPIPVWLHGILTPDSSHDLQRASWLLGKQPWGYFLSLDPTQTAFRLMQLITGLAIFMVVSDAAREPGGRKAIWIWVLASALTLFAIALGHQLLGIEKIWGVYGRGGAFFDAPLLNQNHLARVFGVLSLLCMTQRKLVFMLASVLCGLGVFLTQSRWGILAFLACLLITNVPKRVVMAILGVTAVLALGLVTSELASLGDPQSYWGKIQLLEQVPSLLARHWLMGIGPGALAVEFHKNIAPNFDAGVLFGSQYIITHLENTTLQTLVDHGLIKGLILCLVAAWTLWQVHRKSPQLVPVFLFVWIADFSDFSFESGTVLYWCIVTLALAYPPFVKGGQGGFLRSGVLSLILIAIASVPFVFYQRPNYLQPRIAYHEVLAAWHRNDLEAEKAWLRYTIHRRPTFYQAHLTLARLTGDLDEYKQAIAAEPGLLLPILKEVGSSEVLPSRSHVALEALLEYEMSRGDVVQALGALQELIKGRTPDGEQVVWFAQIRTMQQGLVPTLDESLNWAKELKNPCPFWVWRLDNLAGAGRPRQALSELESARDCLNNFELKKADLYGQLGEYGRAIQIIRGLLRADPENSTLKAKYAGLEQELNKRLE